MVCCCRWRLYRRFSIEDRPTIPKKRNNSTGYTASMVRTSTVAVRSNRISNVHPLFTWLEMGISIAPWKPPSHSLSSRILHWIEPNASNAKTTLYVYSKERKVPIPLHQRQTADITYRYHYWSIDLLVDDSYIYLKFLSLNLFSIIFRALS